MKVRNDQFFLLVTYWKVYDLFRSEKEEVKVNKITKGSSPPFSDYS